MASILDILGQSKANSLAPAGGYEQGTNTYGGSSAAAPLGTPAPSSGGGNPFSNAMFASDSGGITGLIGRLSGNPTESEYQLQRMGGEQAQGLAALQSRIANGMTPQQAVVDFTGSPEGIKFFGSSQDPIGAIKGFLQMSQKAPDKFEAVSPGSTLANMTQGKLTDQTVPTTELQTAKGFMDLANLDPEGVQTISKAFLNKMSSTTENKTQKEAAIDWLVANGKLDKLTGEKWKAGLILVDQPRDAGGKPIGQPVIYDTTTQQSTILGGQNPAGPGTGANAAVTDPNTGKPARPSADMIFGAGTAGNVAATGGGALGNITPELGGQVATKHQAALNNIFSKVIALSEGNTRLAATLKPLMKTVDQSGFLDNPSDQAAVLMQLNDIVQGELDHAKYVMKSSDSLYTGALKDKVSADIYALEDLQNALPEQADLQRAYGEAQKGRGGIKEGLTDLGKNVGKVVKDVQSTVGAGVDAAKGGVSATEKAVEGQTPTPGQNAPQSFKTPQDAAAAADKGLLTPGPDGTITVIIDGKSKIMRPKK